MEIEDKVQREKNGIRTQKMTMKNVEILANYQTRPFIANQANERDEADVHSTNLSVFIVDLCIAYR